MKLTPDDLQHLAGHLGLLVGQVRRAPLPFLIAVMKKRGYDEQALATLAKLHPQEAHKLILWSQHQEHEVATAAMDSHGHQSGCCAANASEDQH
ncbi:MAG: hypothetical protein ICV68_18555 [Pyrinomonadaceae bacterium]|nr:hypothetical protein [Pyrinomonadaceae bacterium]